MDLSRSDLELRPRIEVGDKSALINAFVWNESAALQVVIHRPALLVGTFWRSVFDAELRLRNLTIGVLESPLIIIEPASRQTHLCLKRRAIMHAMSPRRVPQTAISQVAVMPHRVMHFWNVTLQIAIDYSSVVNRCVLR